MSTNKQDILKMGNMLLEGWKMLGQGCPICGTAIMSKDGNMRCPKCDLPIVLESSLSKDHNFFTENPVKNKNENLVENNLDNNRNKFQSLEEAKIEYDKKNRREQDTTSDLIGQYLLKGWTLLGAECPKCLSTPLMCHNGGPKYCVLCKQNASESQLDDTSQMLPQLRTPEETKLASRFDMSTIPMLDSNMSDQPVTSEGDSRDILNGVVTLQKTETDFVEKWSQQISAKLLLGWVLLDEVCMQKNRGCQGDLPLLRDLSGKKYCVKCGYQEETISQENAVGSNLNNNNMSDDDIDIDDDAAIKVQKIAMKSLARKSQDVTNASIRNNEDELAGVHHSGGEYIAGSSFLCKGDIISIIDKKLHFTSYLLDSEATTICEAIDMANLIKALAEARRAVSNI